MYPPRSFTHRRVRVCSHARHAGRTKAVARLTQRGRRRRQGRRRRRG